MDIGAVIYTWNLSWIVFLLFFHPKNNEAGITPYSRRLAREIYPEIERLSDGSQEEVCVLGDVVYTTGETVPSEQACLKCKCQPPGVQCETIKCTNKVGCKTIHRPNHCCPEYQCECNHKGTIYANGEILKASSDGDCKVCYCRGGEIQCAEVSCYTRSDCLEQTLPGQCCPKYDHCPPTDSLSVEPVSPTLLPENTQSPTQQEISKNLQKYSLNVTTENNKTATQNHKELDGINKLKITIEEIIPEEIKIAVPDSFSHNESSYNLSQKSAEPVNSSVNDLTVTDPQPDASEVAEVFQQPSPVLRIGDKLLFLKQGQFVSESDVSESTPVITLIGAEGLQRGYEESIELHDPANNSNYLSFNNSNNLEQSTSQSNHILSLVRYKQNRNSNHTVVVETKTTTTKPTDSKDQFVQTSINSLHNETLDKSTIIDDDSINYWNNNENLTTQYYDHQFTEKYDELELNNNESMTKDVDETQNKKTSARIINVDEFATSTDNYVRSVESIEDVTEDSGENTTQRDNYASAISTENASIENTENRDSESMDMLQSSGSSMSFVDSVENVAIENVDKSEVIPVNKDVEIINSNGTDIINIENIHVSSKSVGKRENSANDEADEVFKQLDAELNIDFDDQIQTPEEEKEQSDRIFQELLDETRTPKPITKDDKNAETLQRITDTIARLTLRGRKTETDGPSVLGMLSNFFTSQYRFNGKK